MTRRENSVVIKRKIRALFLLIIIVFIVEFLITIKFDQPYPAIIYPSFRHVPKSLKKPTLKVFFSNQDSMEINTASFFCHLSSNISSFILTENFSAKTSFLKSSRTWKDFNLHIGPNRVQIKINRIQDNKEIKKGVFWIKNRLIEITNRTDVDSLEVQWYDLLDSVNNPIGNNLAEKFIINLK